MSLAVHILAGTLLVVALFGCSSPEREASVPEEAPVAHVAPDDSAAKLPVPASNPVPIDAAPVPDAPPGPSSLVDITKVIPDAVLDIRYATANNFVGVVLYERAACYLRPAVADKLKRAAEILRGRGYLLRLWDCYRPFSVQERLYLKVADPRYVGRPKRDSAGKPASGSRHNRGAAVDVSLVALDGSKVEMPTDYDDFSRRAHRSALRAKTEGARNARILESAMMEAGFVGLPTEWWHFDARGWKRYGLLDEAF